MKEIFVFIIAFVFPFVYWRTLFVVAKNFAEKPKLVGKTGIQIHHLHYGVVIIFLATVVELFLGSTLLIITLKGLGLGLILDEFIPSLMLPEHRPLGLALYRKSFRGTLILFTTIAVLVAISAFFYFR